MEVQRLIATARADLERFVNGRLVFDTLLTGIAKQLGRQRGTRRPEASEAR